MHTALKIVLGFSCTMSFSVAMAQNSWPSQPIKVVVAYPAGAMGDTVMRLLSDDLSKQLGQPVIVDNRGGAGGNIGTSAVVHSRPDGYTFLLAAANNYSINQYIYKNTGFNVQKDLVPVSALVNVPAVLFASSALPAKTYAEFAQYAKQHPGKVNYGSPGSGTPPHLASELLNEQAGLGLVHVPYKGSSFTVTAILGNEIQVMLAGAGVGLPHVKAGKLKALAVATEQRMVELPDVPTFAELGLNNLHASTWWGMAAPKGTAQEVIDKLNQALEQSLSKPELRKRLLEMGAIPIGGKPSVMQAMVEQDNAFWQLKLKTLKIN
mgnify:CR=1 FL=1